MSDREGGTLDVLNVGMGHLTVRFNREDPLELARGRRLVADMLKRGYALFVEVEGVLRPVRRFDAKYDAYVIDQVADPKTTEPAPKTGTGRRGPYRRMTQRVPATAAKATAIGRTAGG